MEDKFNWPHLNQSQGAEKKSKKYKNSIPESFESGASGWKEKLDRKVR